MNARLFSVIAATALALALGNIVHTQEPPPPPTPDQGDGNPATNVAQEGVDVQARGPVHEAFAEPVVRGPRPTPVVAKRPPDPIEELPPDQKPEGDNVQWIPGYWAWDDQRSDFLWVSGTYRSLPPGRQWVPGYWNQTDGGWQWVAGYWNDEQQPQTDLLPAPPDPVAESPPPAPSSDDSYVPGTWVFRDTRYLWRPGFWMAYRPGWVWVPAHYVWTPAGYIFVEGYWDFPLGRRGLLFAPALINAQYWSQPGWIYRPSVVVCDNFLLGSLFVRLGYHHYYFGDYFEPNYQQAGFVSWINYRMGPGYDPLYSYCRWENRANPAWEREIRQVYAGRYEGTIPRPPRTLVLQQTSIQNNNFVTINNINNTTVNNITNITNITRVAPLASLSQVRRVANLRTVPPAQMTAERQTIQQYRALTQERARVHAQVTARGGPTTGANAAPVRIELPAMRKVKPSSTARTVQAPPPPPIPHPGANPAGAGEAGRAHQPANPATPEGRMTLPRTTTGQTPAAPGKPPGNEERMRQVNPPVVPGKPLPPNEERMRQVNPPVVPGKPPINEERRQINPPPTTPKPPDNLSHPATGERRIVPPSGAPENHLPPMERKIPPNPAPADRLPATERHIAPPQPPPAAEHHPPPAPAQPARAPDSQKKPPPKPPPPKEKPPDK